MVNKGENGESSGFQHSIMLAQSWKRAPVNISESSILIPEFILESGARDVASYFSRVPPELIKYMKEFVWYALKPRIRLCELEDPIAGPLHMRRFLRIGSFVKALDWYAGTFDMAGVARVMCFSSLQNERGVRFIIKDRDASVVAQFNTGLHVAAAGIENLNGRLKITCERVDDTSKETAVTMILRPPNRSEIWCDRENYWSGVMKRRGQLKELNALQQSPMKKHIVMFTIKKQKI